MQRSREQLLSDMYRRLAGDDVSAAYLRNQLNDIIDSVAMKGDIPDNGEMIAQMQERIGQLADRIHQLESAAAEALLPGPAPELEGHIHVTGTSCPMVLSMLDGQPLVSCPSAPAGETMELTLVFTETSVFEVRGAAFRVHPGSPWLVGSDQSFKGCNLYIQADAPETPGTSKRVDVISDLGTVVWMITTAQA